MTSITKKLGLTTVMIALGVASAASYASAVEIEALKTKIKQKDATWQAQPSPFSKEEHKALLRSGAAPEEESTSSDIHLELENWNTESEALPDQFDWRDRGGLNYIPTPGHQGTCGSCVSFAAMSALEAQLNIACDSPDRSFHMSRQFFFSCGGGSCRNGWKLSSAMTFLVDTGVPDATCMPYAAENGNDVQCSVACEDVKQRQVKGISTTKVTAGYIDRDAIKRALLKGPLVSNMILFEDLEFYREGVYRHVDGIQLGSHAVVLVGWDNADSSWIAMNSWGPAWGQNGFFKVAWDDVTLPGRYTWAINVEQPLQSGICNYPR